MRKLFDEHVAAMCGLRVLDHIHFGAIAPNITRESVQGCVEEARAAAIRYFGHKTEG